MTLRTVARSSRTNDMAMAPEAYARTSADGRFVFGSISPGEKMVFAILDESENRHFWISNDAPEFTLAEGEEARHRGPVDGRGDGRDQRTPRWNGGKGARTRGSGRRRRNLFARGRFEVPCAGKLELTLEHGVLVSGVLVDESGAPVRRGSLRVRFAGMRAGEWWTSLRSDDAGRFALSGGPPDSTLVFERSVESVRVGATDVAEVTLVKHRL